ncbi:neprilysin-1-like isoform X2 [Dermacentor variabilis]|uniref:neprilysin-1-like isoform X2 n=1 Tax=Dermacentor variabilis TaxID=34621 RepID=UPI003F5B7EBE
MGSQASWAMQAQPRSKAPKPHSKSAKTAETGSKGKAPPETTESVKVPAKPGKSTPDRSKSLRQQRHHKLGKPRAEVASSWSAEQSGAVRKEAACERDKEAAPMTLRNRLSKAPTPGSPKSGAASPVGSGQRDGVQAKQNKVTVGRRSEGKRSPQGSRSPTHIRTPAPVSGSAVIAGNSAAVASKEPRPTCAAEGTHHPVTPVAGQEVPAEQDPRPHSAAEPAPCAQQVPRISESPTIASVITPRETSKPSESRFTMAEGTRLRACNTPACEAYSSLLLASINSSVEPCESFSRYVCDGWSSSHDLTVSEDSIQAALDQIHRLAADSEVPACGQNAMQRATAFYLSCECVGRGECDELQKVKAALREAGIVWPHRAPSPSVVKTLLYTSMTLRWASVLDVQVVPRANQTLVYLRISTEFRALRSKFLEQLHSPGVRKRYFDVLRYYFKSKGDVVTNEGIVTFEHNHHVEVDIMNILSDGVRTESDVIFGDSDVYYVDQEVDREVWIDALRDYGVRVGESDEIVFKTDTPAFALNFVTMWDSDKEPDLHVFVSWCTVQVAALFANRLLQANFYGSPSKARVGHGVSCFSKTLLLVGDQALYAYRQIFLPYMLREMAEAIVVDVRHAMQRRVQRWSRHDTNLTVVRDWDSTSIALKYFNEESRGDESSEALQTRPPGADMGKSLVDNWRLVARAALSDPTTSRASGAIEKLQLYVLQNGSVPQGPDLSLLPYAFSFPYFNANAFAAVNYAGVGSLVAQGLTELFLDALSKSKADSALQTYLECMRNSSSSSLDRSKGALYMDPISLKTSLDAYRSSRDASSNNRVQGLEFLSSEQLFFVAACFTRCVGGDARSGSFAHAQCDATIKHVDEFARVFGCPPESPMNPAQRCKLF